MSRFMSITNYYLRREIDIEAEEKRILDTSMLKKRAKDGQITERVVGGKAAVFRSTPVEIKEEEERERERKWEIEKEG
mgnify:FL=1